VGIVAAILTVLVCFLFYYSYKEYKKARRQLEVKIKKLKAEIRVKEK